MTSLILTLLDKSAERFEEQFKGMPWGHNLLKRAVKRFLRAEQMAVVSAVREMVEAKKNEYTLLAYTAAGISREESKKAIVVVSVLSDLLSALPEVSNKV